MNKSELVEQVPRRAGLSHGQATGAVEATLAAIEAELAAGRDGRDHRLRAPLGGRAQRSPGA